MLNHRKEIVYPLLLASLLLSITIAWLFYAMYQLVDMSNKKDIVDAQRYNIVALSNAISDAESGQRGYLITNNALFLESVEVGRADVKQIFSNIAALSKHFPQAVGIIQEVKKLTDEKFKIMDLNIQIQLSAGSYASHLSVSKDEGRLVMEKINADLAVTEAILLDYKGHYDAKIKEKIQESMLGAILLVLMVFGILTLSYKHNMKLITQIIESKVAVESLSFQATHDALTNLPNRRAFESHLKNVHAVALRTHKKYAVFYMDLDGFKSINDLYGHDTGDALLIEVAKLFTKTLREYDYLARLGGDEFALVVDQFQTRAELMQLAKRLISALHEPLWISGRELKIGVSIGIAEYPKDARSIEMLQVEADSAMYKSKNAGKNRYSFAG